MELLPGWATRIAFAQRDLLAHKHTLTADECPASAAVDQVELLQAGLIDGALQQSLALFCMAHLHAPVGRAALFQADRHGFTVLGNQIALTLGLVHMTPDCLSVTGSCIGVLPTLGGNAQSYQDLDQISIPGQ